MIKDSTVLVNTILEWSSTSFRLNKNRLYLGVRLLRLWKDEGIEINHSILHLIEKSSTISSPEADSICRLILELIRSRHFSTSRFLQWMLAMEPFLTSYPQDEMILAQQSESFQSHSERSTKLPILLLRNIPLQGLPQHTLNLRQTLLRRYGCSVHREIKEAVLVQEVILRTLPVAAHHDESPTKDFRALESFKMESRSVSVKASQLVRSAILARKRHQMSIRDWHSPLLDVNEFKLVRKFFEKHDEFAIFADVMKVAAKFCERTLLYDVTFALNWHLGVFQAIGVAKCIFSNLYARAENTSSQRLDELPFLLLLAEVGERLLSPQNRVQFLHHLIRQCNPLPPIAACSPVADPDTELLDGSDAIFFEEMEMVLTSGNSMDRPALSQLFSIVTTRLEKEWANNSQPLGPLFDLLNRLRKFDEEALDALLTKWLRSITAPNVCKDLPRIVVPLVCSAMTTLSSFLDLMIANIHTFGNGPESCELARQVLGLLTIKTEHADVTKYLGSKLTFQTYRWAVEKDHLLRTETPAFSFLFQTMLESGTHMQRYGPCNICAFISETSFADLMHTLIIFQPKVRNVLEDYLASDVLHEAMDQAVNHFHTSDASFLSNGSISSDTSVLEVASGIQRLLDKVDDFNIAFTRLSLTVFLRQLKHISGADAQVGVMVMLISVTLSSNNAKHQLMLQLLSILGSTHALEVNSPIADYMRFTNQK